MSSVRRFFETTPQDLISDGLYETLALASFPGAFWPVSVALVARALGATPATTSYRGGFTPGAAWQSSEQGEGRESGASAQSPGTSGIAGRFGSSVKFSETSGAGPSGPSDSEMGRPLKTLKREKSAMFGWGADEEHSIARPPRMSERGRDSWTEEGDSEDRTVSRRAKSKKPATSPAITADLGTTSTEVAAMERGEHGKESNGAGADSSSALADRGGKERPQSLTPHELPGPRELQDASEPANEHDSPTSEDQTSTDLVC